MQTLWIALLTLAACLTLPAAEPAPKITRIEFQESTDAFANPYMGWQTFHHFADDDATLRDLPSGSAYFRFYWRELEPVETRIDLALLDGLLARAHKAGQKLSIGIMLAGSEQYMDTPAWLKDQGCKGYEFRYEGDQIGYRKLMLAFLAISIVALLVWLVYKRWTVKDPLARKRIYRRYALAHLALLVAGVLVWKYAGATHWIPDFEDPLFRKAHGRLIAELGKHLDSHPDFDLIDIGSVGLWGEWHMAHTPRVDTGVNVDMPPPVVLKEIVDAYCTAFPTASKAMLLNEPPTLMHALSKGCGWRADSFGDMGGDSKEWSHMETLYPKWIAEGHAEEAWKTGPVAFESAWDVRRWTAEGWNIRAIFDKGLQYHTSYLNNKSAPLPDQTVEDVRRFIAKMGYRLVLRSVTLAPHVAPGAFLSLAMNWENTGVAPPYRDAYIAIRLTELGNSANVQLMASKTSVKGWLPGPKEVSESFALPLGLKQGRYTLEIALVNATRHEPLMRLAVKGAPARDWFALGEIDVGAPAQH